MILFWLVIYLTIGSALAQTRIHQISIEAMGGDIWFKIAVALKWAVTWPFWATRRG